MAITFCAVIVVLLPLQGDVAYSASMTFLKGCVLGSGVAAVLVFAILPRATSFPSLCLALGLALVPLGFLLARAQNPLFFFAASVNFLPMLSITNGINYDASQFWNTSSAILVGIAVGAVAMLIVPPAPPAIRTSRLLALTLADLRRLARRAPSRRRDDDWESRGVARLLAMPEQAEPVERAALVAAVAVGDEIVRLRRVAPRFVPGAAVDAALQALAEGRSGEAIERLKDVDRMVAALPRAGSRSRILLRLRAGMLSICGQLAGIRRLFRRAGPMRFNEINLFGLYVAPITLIMAVAWVIYVAAPAHRRPLWPHCSGLASGSFRACALCYYPLVDRPRDCALEPLMSGVELKANDVKTLAGIKRRSILSSLRILPVLATVVAVAVAALAGWQAWQYYMGAPWTRDGTVRAYVVKIAPQVAGEIVQLPVADNQFVHKGDLLMLIDPRNYSIAVRQAQAAVEQARAVAENANAEMTRRLKLSDIAVTMEERQTYISQAATAEANLPVGAREPRPGARQSRPHAGPLPGQRLCHQSYRPAWRLRRCRGPPAFGRQLRLVLGRRLFRGDRSRPDPRRRRRDDQAHGIQPRCCAAGFRGSRAASMSRTRRPTPRGSPRSIRSSPSCASPSACRCAFTSMRFQRGSSSSPA